MVIRALDDASRPSLSRDDTCVVVMCGGDDRANRDCLQSVLRECAIDGPPVVAIGADGRLAALAHDLPGGEILWLAASPEERGETAALAQTLSLLEPDDILLLTIPCLVGDQWVQLMREAARSDTNYATASALSISGTPLSLTDDEHPASHRNETAHLVVAHSARLRPRLEGAIGPCVYIRRTALALTGDFDTGLALPEALQDFSERCAALGLGHVVADDVVVRPLGVGEVPRAGSTPPLSHGVRRALEAARRPVSRLPVTFDARGLGETNSGTQLHILELARALADTSMLRLRILVSDELSGAVLEELQSLPDARLLRVGKVHGGLSRDAVFCRPQQMFESKDLRFALSLGDSLVLTQMDLIAYRNAAYFPDRETWAALQLATRRSLASADRVAVFSEHTRDELLAEGLVDRSRLSIVPPGLDHQVGAPAVPTLIRGKDEPFLLCLGADYLHKNRPFAIALIRELRERHGWPGYLVLAGAHVEHGSSSAAEQSLLERDVGLSHAVLDLGAVSEAEKAWLMSRAAAVAYPSLYEGFGLVPFEAAIAGTPCLFAAHSALAEVLPAEQAVIVPWDVSASAHRTITLLRDPTALRHQVESIATRARRLNWAATAAAMVELFEQAAVAPIPPATPLACEELALEESLAQLRRRVGYSLSLIGPDGSLPEDLQRGLLALDAHPYLSRALFAGARAGRALRHNLRGPSKSER